MMRSFALVWLIGLAVATIAHAEDKPVATQDGSPIRNYTIQLQNADPAVLARSHFQMVVMDASRDGTDDTAYTKDEISRVRLGEKGGGPKKVIGYLSTGEAENYRYYWKPEWTEHPPAWMGPEDPEWHGNFKVRFWDPAWQELLHQAIDRLIDKGYDGAFIDVVDAGEFWIQEAPSAQRNPDAEKQMVELVKSLAEYAHRRDPHFGLFPNGAPLLGRFPDYVKTVDGLFVEDIWYNGNHRQATGETAFTLSALQPFLTAHKPVFALDYPAKPKQVEDFYQQAQAAGLIPYATVRNLDRMVVNPGHEP